MDNAVEGGGFGRQGKDRQAKVERGPTPIGVFWGEPIFFLSVWGGCVR